MITDLNKVKNAEELKAGVGIVIPAESKEIVSEDHRETMQEKRTPEQIGAEIRMYVNTGRWITTLCAIEIGRRLVEAKELLPHGEWIPWLKKETEFSERSAQDYMRVFEDYTATQLSMFGPETNTQTFADLPFSKALALLSVPESEREAFAKEVDAEHISVRDLKRAIKEREQQLEDEKKQREQTEDLLKTQDQMLADAKAQIAELAKLNKELENRPHEVAVETVRDEEAIAAAAKEARAKAEGEAVKQMSKLTREHDKTLKELHAKLSEAKEKLEKAEKEAQSAGEGATEKADAARKEAEALREQLEEARKQLKTSEADVTAFSIYFQAVQADFENMMAELERVERRDQGKSEKLRAAVRELIKQIREQVERNV